MAISRPADLLSTAGPTPFQVAAMTVAASMVLAVATLQPGRGGSPDPAPPAPIGTASPDATVDPTAEPTRTPRPTATQTPTPSPSPTATPSPSPVATPAPTAPPPAPTAAPQTPVPPPPPGGGSLPSCAYADVLTPHHGLDEWQITLLDTIYQLPSTYAPGDLVDSSAAGLNSGYLIRSFMVNDLRALVADARAAGSPIQVVSGYRSYSQQKATFDHWVSVGGYEQALRTSARPGHSEHQLGTAIDVTSEGGAAPWEYADWASTPAGAWMAANAHRYGFVMSYPPGASAVSCYSYEPWHYRYVGRELAAQVAAGGSILRVVLWGLQ